jgi:hypothetical protein
VAGSLAAAGCQPVLRHCDRRDRRRDTRRHGHLPYLFAAAITGFLLVAPMLLAGLYELSRRYLAGEPATV